MTPFAAFLAGVATGFFGAVAYAGLMLWINREEMDE